VAIIASLNFLCASFNVFYWSFPHVVNDAVPRVFNFLFMECTGEQKIIRK
jgi:hypothetical protein